MTEKEFNLSDEIYRNNFRGNSNFDFLYKEDVRELIRKGIDSPQDREKQLAGRTRVVGDKRPTSAGAKIRGLFGH